LTTRLRKHNRVLESVANKGCLYIYVYVHAHNYVNTPFLLNLKSVIVVLPTRRADIYIYTHTTGLGHCQFESIAKQLGRFGLRKNYRYFHAVPTRRHPLCATHHIHCYCTILNVHALARKCEGILLLGYDRTHTSSSPITRLFSTI